jgi:hypothetical protein
MRHMTPFAPAAADTIVERGTLKVGHWNSADRLTRCCIPLLLLLAGYTAASPHPGEHVSARIFAPVSMEDLRPRKGMDCLSWRVV